MNKRILRKQHVTLRQINLRLQTQEKYPGDIVTL